MKIISSCAGTIVPGDKLDLCGTDRVFHTVLRVRRLGKDVEMLVRGSTHDFITYAPQYLTKNRYETVYRIES